MPSSTVEDYVKQIYLLQQQGDGLVALGHLSSAMGVVPGTVTTMVKALADSDLVRYEPRQGVALSPAGERLALHVLRRHRLVELFLVKVLDFDWSDVHDEAEEMEHAISDRLLEKIDVYLGRPTYDPHGDPIPNAAGKIAKRKLRTLGDVEPDERVRIARVIDQDPAFLRYAVDHGLIPDAAVHVTSKDPVGDAIGITLDDGRTMTLGGVASAKILVAGV